MVPREERAGALASRPIMWAEHGPAGPRTGAPPSLAGPSVVEADVWELLPPRVLTGDS